MKQARLPGMEKRRLCRGDIKRLVANRLAGFDLRQKVRVETRRQRRDGPRGGRSAPSLPPYSLFEEMGGGGGGEG